MFLVNEILVFSNGRRQEGLDRLDWIHSLMAPKEGFVRALVANYLGDPNTHTVLRVWEDEATFRKFREGPDGNYGRGRPEGLYTNQQVVPQWEGAFEPVGSESGPFLVKMQFEVPEGSWDGFLAAEKRMMELAQKYGLKSGMEFRAKDRSEALNILRFRDRKAFEDTLDSPEMAEANKAVPEGVNPLYKQCFEVVREILPSK